MTSDEIKQEYQTIDKGWSVSISYEDAHDDWTVISKETLSILLNKEL